MLFWDCTIAMSHIFFRHEVLTKVWSFLFLFFLMFSFCFFFFYLLVARLMGGKGMFIFYGHFPLFELILIFLVARFWGC